MEPAATTVSDLPGDVLHVAFSHCGLRALLNAERVCKIFRRRSRVVQRCPTWQAANMSDVMLSRWSSAVVPRRCELPQAVGDPTAYRFTDCEGLM